MNKELIRISTTPENQIQTEFKLPVGNVDTIMIGVALASATRVIAEAFRKELKLDKSHNIEIQKQIAQIYNNDLFEFGSLGEEESVKSL